MTKARSLSMAVIGGLVAGGAALLAAAQTWSTAVHDRPAPFPAETIVSTGMSVVPWIAPAAVVLMAGSIALVAVGATARRVVAAVVLIAGVVTVAGGVLGSIETPGVFPVVVCLMGIIGGAVGIWTWRAGMDWPRMSSRYDRVEQSATEVHDPTALWDALDRGIDPSTSIGRPAPGEEYAR